VDKNQDPEARERFLNQLRLKYHKANKPEKAEMVNSAVMAYGYSRKAAIRTLNKAAREKPRQKAKRSKPSRYGAILPALRLIWLAANRLCGKRLYAIIPLYISRMSLSGDISLSAEHMGLLLAISPASIDRLLRVDREHARPKGFCTTRPGRLLLDQIAVKTFSQWDGTSPGCFAMDWVAFCGDSLKGEFVYVLSMTDIATGWVGLAAFMGRSERAFVEAVLSLKGQLPFALSGIHVDNDMTFINTYVYHFCIANRITMTRSRPNKSNDNCFVEQKNWDVVRKNLGYRRYDTPAQLAVIRRILPLLEVYQNVFQPSMRLL